MNLSEALALLEAADAAHHKIEQAADKAAGNDTATSWWNVYIDAYERAGGRSAFADVRKAEAAVVVAYKAALGPTFTPAQLARAAPLLAAARDRRGFERSRVLIAARKLAGANPAEPVEAAPGPLPFAEPASVAEVFADVREKHHGLRVSRNVGLVIGGMGDHAGDAYDRQTADYDEDA